MLLMDYLSINGEDLQDHAKKTTWNLLHTYIDAHSQRLIEEYPGDGLQSISRLKYQRSNMTFDEQRIYNRLFQKVLHKGGDSEINYIEIFQNSKALKISVENSYSEDQLIHNLLDNFQQGRKYSAQIASHRSELRI